MPSWLWTLAAGMPLGVVVVAVFLGLVLANSQKRL